MVNLIASCGSNCEEHLKNAFLRTFNILKNYCKYLFHMWHCLDKHMLWIKNINNESIIF